jgi:hypothetical protein
MESRLPVIAIDHDEGRNCTEEALVTVASYLGKEYMLMFKDAWYFAYHSPYPTTGPFPIGQALGLDSARESSLHNLAKYHGLCFCYTGRDAGPDLQDAILQELKCCKPVSIDIDGYWCPWTPDYQARHIDHGIVVSGIDAAERCYICTDSFYGVNRADLPFDHFERGVLGIYTYETSSAEEYPYVRICRDMLDNYRKYESDSCLTQFAADFATYFDFQEEIAREVNYVASPFYLHFDRYRKGRKLASGLLHFTSAKCRSASQQRLAVEMHEIFKCWDLFHKYLLKCYLANRFDGAKAKLMRFLEELIEKETRFCDKLKEEWE